MILIKNGTVVDGTGEPAYRADILISNTVISAIGHFPNKKADTVIDGMGMHVIPGFIATTTHADRMLTLFTDPTQNDYRKQGITTIIGGTDGISLAPLLYGSLRSIKKWTDTDAVNVDWHTVAQCAKIINRLPLGVNFATFAGYTTIRRDIANDNAGDLTDNEMRAAMQIIEQAIREGALGVSLNADSAHGRSIPYHEFTQASIAAAHARGVVSLCLRAPEQHCVKATHEALALHAATGATVIARHFIPHTINTAREKELLVAHAAIEKAGNTFFTEISCAPAEPTPIYALLPRVMQKKGLDAMYALVREPKHHKEIMAGFPIVRGARIIHAPREYTSLIGTTIETFARNYGLSLKEGLVKLMDITRMRAVIALPNAFSALHEKVMDCDRTLISGPPKIALAIADQKRWPIEKTIARLTSLPARAYNLRGRGSIQENYVADLAIMNSRHDITHTIVSGSLEAASGRFIRL